MDFLAGLLAVLFVGVAIPLYRTKTVVLSNGDQEKRSKAQLGIMCLTAAAFLVLTIIENVPGIAWAIFSVVWGITFVLVLCVMKANPGFWLACGTFLGSLLLVLPITFTSWRPASWVVPLLLALLAFAMLLGAVRQMKQRRQQEQAA